MKKLSILFVIILASLVLLAPFASADLRSSCGQYVREFRQVESKIKELNQEGKQNVEDVRSMRKAGEGERLKMRNKEIEFEIGKLRKEAKSILENYLKCARNVQSSSGLSPQERNIVKKVKARMQNL